jgi:hypothetical protein
VLVAHLRHPARLVALDLIVGPGDLDMPPLGGACRVEVEVGSGAVEDRDDVGGVLLAPGEQRQQVRQRTQKAWSASAAPGSTVASWTCPSAAKVARVPAAGSLAWKVSVSAAISPTWAPCPASWWQIPCQRASLSCSSSGRASRSK